MKSSLETIESLKSLAKLSDEINDILSAAEEGINRLLELRQKPDDFKQK